MTAQIADAVTANPTEQTALLAEERRRRSTESSSDHGQADEQDLNNNPPVKEYGAKELLPIMSGVWLGSFLAALGVLALSFEDFSFFIFFF